VLIAIQFQKRILGEYRTVRKVNSKITAAYNENITGVRVVKALGREAQNLQEFEQHTREMYQASLRAAILSALFLPMVATAERPWQLPSSYGTAALAQPAWLG
jgi:ATP-binding cassette subfamily B protein